MKNIIKTTIYAIFAFVVGYNIYASQKVDNISDLALNNVAALASGDEANSNGNTGPSELFDCPWWFTGDGIHCKCEYFSACTAVLCD